MNRDYIAGLIDGYELISEIREYNKNIMISDK